MTPKQAASALYALDNLEVLRPIEVPHRQWEQIALMRLRHHLINLAGDAIPPSYFDAPTDARRAAR